MHLRGLQLWEDERLPPHTRGLVYFSFFVSTNAMAPGPHTTVPWSAFSLRAVWASHACSIKSSLNEIPPDEYVTLRTGTICNCASPIESSSFALHSLSCAIASRIGAFGA